MLREKKYYFPADDTSSTEAGKDRSGWVSSVINSLQASNIIKTVEDEVYPITCLTGVP